MSELGYPDCIFLFISGFIHIFSIKFSHKLKLIKRRSNYVITLYLLTHVQCRYSSLACHVYIYSFGISLLFLFENDMKALVLIPY